MTSEPGSTRIQHLRTVIHLDPTFDLKTPNRVATKPTHWARGRALIRAEPTYNRKYQTVTESVHAGVVFRCFVTHQKQSDEVSTGFADASTNLLITLTLNKFPT
ncbi:hypothetical protein OUZ56_033403 [Daphnia magna]|uniref:Uncharacterized protein n=1 Tax=Daphnia magna TaxID=35525 RepID=A0ABQ9ZXS9_9CRUS|nr:hypothetical protein OUZ56_033395 [Daphnia magna]KAK4017706.1 hypothetical protein OUZ56_033403 [Daphnia magna]